MTKIASVSILAMVILMVIPTLLGFQNGLVDLQLLDSMREEAALAIPAITGLYIGLAQLDLSLGTLVRTTGRC